MEKYSLRRPRACVPAHDDLRVVRAGLAENVALGQRCEWVGAGMGSWQSWGIALQVERASLQRRGPVWGRRSSQEAAKGGVALGKASSCVAPGGLGGFSVAGLTLQRGVLGVARGGGAPRVETRTRDRLAALSAVCGVDWRAQFKVPTLWAADQ